MTANNYGDIVSGSVVTLPDTDVKFIVGEIYLGGFCKLYRQDNSEYAGQFAIEELEIL